MREAVPPNPSTATDPATFVALLRELRDWAGRPSLRELRRLGGQTVTANGETVDALPTSTISYVLLGKRLPLLPRRSFVDAYVAACLRAADHPAGDVPATVAAWTRVWRNLRGRAPAGPRASTLPRDIHDFTGRDEQLAHITGHLTHPCDATRVVTVDGMPGVGKTTLAVRAAHRLSGAYDDTLFVDLRGHGDRAPLAPLDALAVLLRAAGTPPGGVPAALDEAIALWRNRTASVRTLVVLDNCRDAAQVEPLLPGGSCSAALITGRHRLIGLDGALAVSLRVLSPAHARGLLARIVADDRVRDEAALLDELVAKVGSLPLAVRLLGARLQHRPQWKLSELLAQFADGGAALGRLDDGRRSVAAAFAWSYGQVPAGARRTFRLLALHPGEVGLPAAAALTGRTRAQAREELESLVDAHLVEQPRADRYRMHDLLRAYAAEQSTVEDPVREREAAVADLVAWYTHAVLAGAALLNPGSRRVEPDGPAPAEPYAPGDVKEAVAWFETERANLIACLAWAVDAGLHASAWRLAVRLGPFFEARGYRADWIRTHEDALPCARLLGDRHAEAWLLNSLGIAHRTAGMYAEAIADWKAALAIREEQGDAYGTALALNSLGAGHLSLRRYDDALGYYERSLAIWIELDDAPHQGMTLCNMADLERALGDADACIAYATRAMELARDAGIPRSEAIALHNLGRGLAGSGRHEDAVAAYDRSLAMLRDLEERWGIAATLRHRGDSLAVLDREDEAVDAWREALALFTLIGDPDAEAVAESLRKRGLDGTT